METSMFFTTLSEIRLTQILCSVPVAGRTHQIFSSLAKIYSKRSHNSLSLTTTIIYTTY